MQIARVGRILSSMLVVALVSACASTPASDTAETSPSASTESAEGVIPITINHNKMDQGEMTVYIEPTGGIRSVLGMIATNEIKTFQYRVVGSRNIRLAVSGTTGGGQTSPAITVPEGQGVNWDLSLNTVRLRR